MPGAGQELIFAVRLRVVARYLGQFGLIVAALTLAPLLVALLTGASGVALRYLAVIGLLGLAGRLALRIPEPKRLQVNEALLLAALVFLLTPLVMTIPLCAVGLPWLDALFEAISAATTTGLSTLASVEDKPQAFLFARAWMQWYGGLGIVVLSLALVVRPGLAALRLAETAPPEDDLVGGTRVHARRVLKVYGLMTLAGLFGWVLLGGAPWEGLLYLLSAVSTGGFAPRDGSFADLSGGRLAWLVSLFCLAGAVPLALYHTAWRKGWRQLWRAYEVRALLTAVLVATLVLTACLMLGDGYNWQDAIWHAPLMAISAQTTAGFSTLASGELGNAAQLVLIVAMAAGGGIGSTAGGVKLLRLLILGSLLARWFRRLSAAPRAIIPLRSGGSQLETDEVVDALLLILLFAGAVLLSWLVFLGYGYPPLPALFEVVSALGTVGLSSGLTGPELPAALKLVLCADMLLGRLELIAWLLVFYPRTWFGQRRSFP